MNINNLVKFIVTASEKAESNLDSTLGSFLRDFENQLRSKSPVDSGEFSGAWSSPGSAKSGRGLTGIISNNSAQAGAIEFGSAPGSSPWPSPGPKTVMSAGRIYSSQAVGGTLDKVFNEATTTAFAEALASSIMRAFK